MAAYSAVTTNVVPAIRGSQASVEAASGQERLDWWAAASLFRWARRAGVVAAVDASALRTPRAGPAPVRASMLFARACGACRVT